MKLFYNYLSIPLIAVAALLSACATLTADNEAHNRPKVEPVKAPKPAPLKPAPEVAAPVAAPLSAEPLALKDGVLLYNNGDYNNAIKRLTGASEIWNGGSRATQVSALKYMAFSYCVTGRKTLCRQQFDKALKLDPNFDLAPGENGHPLWGPVFARAKKGK
ncbi:MAG: TssQ family T6SS-associated lipoprotein [Pseudomonadota bacterium]